MVNTEDLKKKLEAASLEFNKESSLEALTGEVEVLTSSSVFSKVAITAEKLQLKRDGSKKVVVTIVERLTENEFKLSLSAVMQMSGQLKTRLNINGLLQETDYVAIKNIALTLAKLCSESKIVDSFPILDDECSCNRGYYEALYQSLIEVFTNNILEVTDVPEDFLDFEKGYSGLLCRKSLVAGRTVILMATDELMSALEIYDKAEFQAIMRSWREAGYIYVSESNRIAGRMQVKHRLPGTKKYSWYCVLPPKGISLDTVSTVRTTK